MTLVAAAACCLHFIMDSAARALSERKRFDVCFTLWVSALLWSAALAMVVWLSVKIAPELLRGPTGREATHGATGQS
jgi:hypothetical protein